MAPYITNILISPIISSICDDAYSVIKNEFAKREDVGQYTWLILLKIQTKQINKFNKLERLPWRS